MEKRYIIHHGNLYSKDVPNTPPSSPEIHGGSAKSEAISGILAKSKDKFDISKMKKPSKWLVDKYGPKHTEHYEEPVFEHHP